MTKMVWYVLVCHVSPYRNCLLSVSDREISGNLLTSTMAGIWLNGNFQLVEMKYVFEFVCVFVCMCPRAFDFIVAIPIRLYYKSMWKPIRQCWSMTKK